MKKTILFLMFVLVFSGCASASWIKGEKENEWYIKNSSFLGGMTSDLYYCKANPTKDGALPMCFQAKIVNQ